MALKKGNEIPTIDVALVTYSTGQDGTEIALDTASKIGVEVQMETEEAVKLVVKGKLRAQKPAINTITGNTITLTDNVFNPELVKLLQGGTIKYDTKDSTKVVGYTPPVAGSNDKGTPGTLNAYSAIYNAAGIVTGYEKISYPNCIGNPIAFSSEDGVFRAPEYTINSAPNTGEAPYEITYVDTLPAVS